MKNQRFRHSYRDSASKLHRKIGDLLRSHPAFKHHKLYQEYPVNKINSDADSRWHFDWVIPNLKIVIEVHGQQHYKVCTFGMKVEDAIDSFHNIQRRDQLKKDAALAAGFTYIVIPYNKVNSLTGSDLLQLIKENTIDSDDIVQTNTKPVKEQTEYKKRQLEKAREYRKKRYQQLKEYKNG